MFKKILIGIAVIIIVFIIIVATRPSEYSVTRSVVKSAVCLYTNTPDQHFVIDRHPESSRIVVLSVCSGHGFKFSPVVGDIAADLLLEDGTKRDISRFAMSRFTKAAD